MNNMSIRIKERRLALGYTQEELAVKLGLQKSAIAKYENGRVENIKRSIIGKMSEILECSPAYLMGFDEDDSGNTRSGVWDDEPLKQILSKNLRTLLSKNNLQQLEVAKAIDVIPSTFNTWCTGQALPRMGKLQALANYFNIQISDLISDNNSNETMTAGVKIPVYGSIAAGIPISMIEDIVDWEEIPQSMSKEGSFYALRVKGDSMEPRIKNGDTVIVRAQDYADDNDIVIITINGYEATCKRLKKYERGIRLIPYNPAYDPQDFSNEEIEMLPISVLGKVVELRRKL